MLFYFNNFNNFRIFTYDKLLFLAYLFGDSKMIAILLKITGRILIIIH